MENILKYPLTSVTLLAPFSKVQIVSIFAADLSSFCMLKEKHFKEKNIFNVVCIVSKKLN